MNIIFFQNCISPHQIPYQKELPSMEGVEDVLIISPSFDLDERKDLGWNSSEMDGRNLQIVISPSEKMVDELFEKYSNKEEEVWCLFSGINAFPEVTKWFRQSLSYKVKRGIITEPPYLYDHPLWQHAIRFAIQDWRFVKYIDKFYLMGEDYQNYYKFWSSKWSVIPFLYCTEWKERILSIPKDKKLRILYVGALSVRKNVSLLFKALASLSTDIQENIEIGIVGDGDQRQVLELQAKEHLSTTSCHFYGSVPMGDISNLMEQYDVLVLPSLHDGWGAVVNEALILGLYVICSNKCGAKSLLKDAQNGSVFESNNCADLKNKLLECVEKHDWIRQTCKDRINWAKEHISGGYVATYFLETLKKKK